MKQKIHVFLFLAFSLSNMRIYCVFCFVSSYVKTWFRAMGNFVVHYLQIFIIFHCLKDESIYQANNRNDPPCYLAFQVLMNMAWRSSKLQTLQEKIPWPSALMCRRDSSISSAAATCCSQTTSEPPSTDTVRPWSISGQCSGTKGSSTRGVMKAGTPHKMKASSRRCRW